MYPVLRTSCADFFCSDYLFMSAETWWRMQKMHVRVSDLSLAMNDLEQSQWNVLTAMVTQTATYCHPAGGIPVWRLPGEEQGHSEWRTDQCAEGQQGEGHKHRHTPAWHSQRTEDVHLNTPMCNTMTCEAATEIKAKTPAARGELWHLVCCLLTSPTCSLSEAAPSAGHEGVLFMLVVKTITPFQRFNVREV